MMTFFNLLWDAANGEIERMRNALTYICIATGVSGLLILIFRPTMGKCFWIIVVSWIFSLYHLFSIRRFIRLHITGETLEFLGALMANPIHPTTGTTMFDNPFIRVYWNVITGICLFQSSLLLALPLYVNYTSGGLTEMIPITMLSVTLLILSPKIFKGVFAGTTGTMMLTYFVILIFVLFPQAGFYTGKITGGVHVVPASTAKLINEYNNVKAKQIEDVDNDCLKKGIAWQNANPGKKPPQWFTEALAKNR